MDYSLLTIQQLQKRYDSLPDNLKEILNSENNIGTLRQISRSHYLDEERGLILEQLAGLVILGFLSVEELSLEVQENLHLNPKHSNELAQEIDRKIFSPIKTDLEKVYSPVSEMPKEIPKTKPLETNSLEPLFEPKLPTQPPAELPIVSLVEPLIVKPNEPFYKAPASVKTTAGEQDKPFILHQETEFNPAAEKKRVSFPAIGWFKKPVQEKSKIPEPPAKVELETKGFKPFDAAQGKEPVIAKTEPPKQKVIHYKETGAPTPFGKIPETPAPIKPPEIKPPAEESKVINLDSFE